MGGCTFSEISALRFLGREKGEGTGLSGGPRADLQEGLLYRPLGTPATILLGTGGKAGFTQRGKLLGPSMVLVHLGLQTGALTQPGLWNWRTPLAGVGGLKSALDHIWWCFTP